MLRVIVDSSHCVKIILLNSMLIDVKIQMFRFYNSIHFLQVWIQNHFNHITSFIFIDIYMSGLIGHVSRNSKERNVKNLIKRDYKHR